MTYGRGEENVTISHSEMPYLVYDSGQNDFLGPHKIETLRIFHDFGST